MTYHLDNAKTHRESACVCAMETWNENERADTRAFRKKNIGVRAARFILSLLRETSTQKYFFLLVAILKLLSIRSYDYYYIFDELGLGSVRLYAV